MKIFFSEYDSAYDTYTFAYAVYCLMESQDELTEIYEKGFLPFTNILEIQDDLFYLTRSLRVDLPRFSDTAENRRIDRKVQELQLELEVIPKTAFDLGDAAFLDFCKTYFHERIGEASMSMDRWQYILSRSTATHFFRYSSNGKPLGYVLGAMNGVLLHYWFAVFDLPSLKTHSLGKWMMWRTIRWALENGLHYVYLGTAYRSAALYKFNDFKGIEFFDGMSWNPDMQRLKLLCSEDPETSGDKDRFKIEPDPDGVLKRILRS